MFGRVRPKIVGALLIILCRVLAELPRVHPVSMPRMAEFARVGVAVERALGWPDGSFLAAYLDAIRR